MKKRKQEKGNDDREGKERKFVRTFEHVDGQWPSHVYVRFRSNRRLSKLMTRCVQHYRTSQKDSALSDGIAVESDPHVSLSRPFSLRYHQIAPFIQQLACELKGIHKSSFTLPVYNEYTLLYNDSHTRQFVCVPIHDRTGDLGKLVAATDRTMKRFQKQCYYENPKFHVSVASFIPLPLPLSLSLSPASSRDLKLQSDAKIAHTIDKDENGDEDVVTIEVPPSFNTNDDEAEDDDDDDSDNDCKETKSSIALMEFSSIEIKIGNRLFALELELNARNDAMFIEKNDTTEKVISKKKNVKK